MAHAVVVQARHLVPIRQPQHLNDDLVRHVEQVGVQVAQERAERRRRSFTSMLAKFANPCANCRPSGSQRKPAMWRCAPVRAPPTTGVTSDSAPGDSTRSMFATSDDTRPCRCQRL